MTAFKIKAFSGIAPKIDKKLLPDGYAQIASNCRIISGALKSFSEKLFVSTNSLVSSGDIKTIFKIGKNGSEYWLSWGKEVDCVPGQIAGDTSKRIYWTGDNEPRLSNYAMAVGGGSGVMPISHFVLGVTAPINTPTITVTGGSGTTVSRAYVETFVTQWGEESAPGPVRLLSGFANGSWDITGLTPIPVNTSTISGVVKNTGYVTIETPTTKHLRASEEIVHAGVVGMTDLNGNYVIRSIVDTTHYTVDLTTAQNYTSGGTWTRVSPHNITNMKRRIYRTLSGSYFQVAELDAASVTTYNDTIADTALGAKIKSIGWDMPPVGLKGLIPLPNRFMAGYDGNDIVFSEQNYPHAWPYSYRLACGNEVMSIGAFGSSIIVGTKGAPYVINGSHPSNLSMEKAAVIEPCLSTRGMADTGDGVVYTSASGLVFAGNGGVRVLTSEIFSRDEWKLLKPATMKLLYHNGLIFCIHDTLPSRHNGFVFDISKNAFSPIAVNLTSIFVDPETNNLYFTSSGKVYQWDAHPFNDIGYDWKSKAYYFSRPVNFNYAQVDAEFTDVARSNAAILQAAAEALAHNTTVLASGLTYGEFDHHMLDEYMLDGSVLRGDQYTTTSLQYMTFAAYADGVEKFSSTIENNKAFSLPSGFKANVWEFRVSGNIPTSSVSIAESASEIRGLA